MNFKKSKSILLITSILGLLICTLVLIGTLFGNITLEDTNNSQMSTKSTAIIILIYSIVHLTLFDFRVCIFSKLFKNKKYSK